MSEVKRTLLECLLVAFVAVLLALAANRLSPSGLDLGGNYSVTEDPEIDVAARLAEKGIQVIRHEDVVALYQDELYAYEAYAFVDARNDDHYQSGHIPGAYQFDHFHMERYTDEVVPACQGALKVVVYCYGQDCTDSEIVAKHLFNFGVDPSLLHVYLGGMEAWCKAGFDVELGERGSGDIGKCETGEPK